MLLQFLHVVVDHLWRRIGSIGSIGCRFRLRHVQERLAMLKHTINARYRSYSGCICVGCETSPFLLNIDTDFANIYPDGR